MDVQLDEADPPRGRIIIAASPSDAEANPLFIKPGIGSRQCSTVIFKSMAAQLCSSRAVSVITASCILGKL